MELLEIIRVFSQRHGNIFQVRLDSNLRRFVVGASWSNTVRRDFGWVPPDSCFLKGDQGTLSAIDRLRLLPPFAHL
jgi:hypothetical protein